MQIMISCAGLLRAAGIGSNTNKSTIGKSKLVTSSLHCGLRPYLGESGAGEVILIHHATSGQSRSSDDFLRVLACICIFYLL